MQRRRKLFLSLRKRNFTQEDGTSDMSIGESAMKFKAGTEQQTVANQTFPMERRSINCDLLPMCHSRTEVIPASISASVNPLQYEFVDVVGGQAAATKTFEGSTSNVLLDREIPRTSAYDRHVSRVIKEILEKRAKLLSTRETQTLFMFTTLSSNARDIFIRLLSRRGTWYTITPLSRYLSTSAEDPVFLEAIRALKKVGYIETLCSDEQRQHHHLLHDFYEVIDDCVTLSDLKRLSTKLKGIEGLAAARNKEQYIQALKRALKSQRQLDGRSLSVSMLIQHLRGPESITTRDFDGFLRIHKATATLYRRILRLYYCNFPSASHQHTHGHFEELDEEISILAYSKVAMFWPGLLVEFKKLKYPQYVCSSKIEAFPSRRHFHALEIAIELSAALRSTIDKCSREGLPDSLHENCSLTPNDFIIKLMALIDRIKKAKVDIPFVQKLQNSDFSSEETDIYSSLAACTALKLQPLDDLITIIAKCVLVFSESLRHEADAPPFLNRFKPEHMLLSSLLECVPLLQKFNAFAASASTVSVMLLLPRNTQIRQRCFERLSLDLQALKLKTEARDICWLGLQDKTTSSSYKMKMRSRLLKLNSLASVMMIKSKVGAIIEHLFHYQRPLRLNGIQLSSESITDWVSLISACRECSRFDRMTLPVFDDMNVSALPVHVYGLFSVALQNALHPGHELAIDTVRDFRVRGRPMLSALGRKNTYAGHNNDLDCSVEDLVTEHFAVQQNGSWHSVHCEGAPIRELFWLLMWDIIYAEVYDVFQTQYQTAPLDLRCRAFLQTRRYIVEKRVMELANMLPPEIMREVETSWISHYGEHCACVSWDRFPLSYLQCVAACIGGQGLAHIFVALCADFGQYSAGMPDLLLCRVGRISSSSHGNHPAKVYESLDIASICGLESKACDDGIIGDDECGRRKRHRKHSSNGGSDKKPHNTLAQSSFPLSEGLVYRWESMLIEVKGPTDRLSEQQIMWLNILSRSGINSGVAYVSYDN